MYLYLHIHVYVYVYAKPKLITTTTNMVSVRFNTNFIDEQKYSFKYSIPFLLVAVVLTEIVDSFLIWLDQDCFDVIKHVTTCNQPIWLYDTITLPGFINSKHHKVQETICLCVYSTYKYIYIHIYIYKCKLKYGGR